ncbi:MAG: multicopper oxidase domain-containing protein [Leptothrix sp. (in: b-proteobacteria)]
MTEPIEQPDRTAGRHVARTAKSRPMWARRGAYLTGGVIAASLSVAVMAQVAGGLTFNILSDDGTVETERSEPLNSDPSHHVTPDLGVAANNALTTLEHTNHGAIENPGGVDKSITTINTSVPLSKQTSFNIPTGGLPSPLSFKDPVTGKFSTPAGDFTDKLLMFEEFGPEGIDTRRPLSSGPKLPSPVSAQNGPDGGQLETFLATKGMFPNPTQMSNTAEFNPWGNFVADFLKADPARRTKLNSAPMEGRPPGEGWQHQRWGEFMPQSGFKTAQAGARRNLGFRETMQHHYDPSKGYSVGEFGPGGLYQRDWKAPLDVKFHSNLPVQNPNSVWTFDGTMPPKLLMVRYGSAVLMRHYNALPIDPSANAGFGLHTISTHEHNGHNPAESDGVAQAFFFPGQFYDYRWPIQLAGYDSINTDASDTRAAYPCTYNPDPYLNEKLWVNDGVNGTTKRACEKVNKTDPTSKVGIIKIRGDWRETMSTHWFHDHMLDFTAQNVYKGNVAMMNYYGSIDRGYEGKSAADCHYGDPLAADPSKVPAQPNLCLPSGSNLEWGNRDYDVNLVLTDKAWDSKGQLWFNVFNKNGFLGDRVLVNFVYHPTLEVRARRYRFRILDGSVSRYFSLALVKEFNTAALGELKGASGTNKSYTRIPFHMVANDGNILEHAVAFDGKKDLDANGDALEHKGTLPQQAIAERYDIVVDFGANGLVAGDKLYFVNLQEHSAPQVTSKRIPIADVLSGKYKVTAQDDNADGVPDRWVGGDPGVGMFMQFQVKDCTLPGTFKPALDSKGVQLKNANGTLKTTCVDNSMDPSLYTEFKADGKTPGLSMVPLKINRDLKSDFDSKLASANRRDFTFGRSGGTDDQPWTVKVDGGAGYNADMRRISAAPTLAHYATPGGKTQTAAPYEVWKLNLGGGWDHPVHIHFEEGVILRRDGKAPPAWETWARKDVFRIGPDKQAGSSVEIAYQFREFAGTFVEHCHATQHEDNAMLVRWDLDRPGQTAAMPTPLPTWDGVHYAGADSLPGQPLYSAVAMPNYKVTGNKGVTYAPPVK